MLGQSQQAPAGGGRVLVLAASDRWEYGRVLPEQDFSLR